MRLDPCSPCVYPLKFVLKFNNATTHKGRGPSSEVSTKVVAMQSRKSYVAAAIVAEPAHLSFASSRTTTATVVGGQATIYTCALYMKTIYIEMYTT